MNNDRTQTQKRSRSSSQGEEWPKKMTLSLARKFLGISFSKLSTMVSSGLIKFERSPLDHRVKLVLRSDLEELKRQYSFMDQQKEMRATKQ